jgi:hypothetical protein
MLKPLSTPLLLSSQRCGGGMGFVEMGEGPRSPCVGCNARAIEGAGFPHYTRAKYRVQVAKFASLFHCFSTESVIYCAPQIVDAPKQKKDVQLSTATDQLLLIRLLLM